ncbi:hypothetical protein [Kitasatospora sp. NPDC090091]|uniref:hypothetical protein n=1 Tax=Kitasatospora sp. NPDC090091 TaxID=3364081 RepID=UPI0037F3EC7C
MPAFDDPDPDPDLDPARSPGPDGSDDHDPGGRLTHSGHDAPADHHLDRIDHVDRIDHLDPARLAEDEDFADAPARVDYADLGELADFDAFLRLSAELTGFDEAELRATGMAHEHHRTVLTRRVRDEHGLVHLWYVGAWPGEEPSSARAYDQGLMWRTFHGSPPGTAAPGYGSWAEAPREGGDR